MDHGNGKKVLEQGGYKEGAGMIHGLGESTEYQAHVYTASYFAKRVELVIK